MMVEKWKLHLEYIVVDMVESYAIIINIRT